MLRTSFQQARAKGVRFIFLRRPLAKEEWGEKG
jgi:hypothetical protein